MIYIVITVFKKYLLGSYVFPNTFRLVSIMTMLPKGLYVSRASLVNRADLFD